MSFYDMHQFWRNMNYLEHTNNDIEQATLVCAFGFLGSYNRRRNPLCSLKVKKWQVYWLLWMNIFLPTIAKFFPVYVLSFNLMYYKVVVSDGWLIDIVD